MIKAQTPLNGKVSPDGCSNAFDMRGHGHSTAANDQKIPFEKFAARDWLQAILDIQAARNALPANGVDPNNLAIVGAGMGANLATHYAAQDESIQALVLISPGLEYDGVRIREAFESYTRRPSLLIATKSDTYAAASAQTLKKLASTFCEVREYPGGAHGMDVLQSLVSARETVVLWLESILKTSGGNPRSSPEDDTTGAILNGHHRHSGRNMLPENTELLSLISGLRRPP